MTESTTKLGSMHISNVRFSYLHCFEPYTSKPTPQQPNPKPTFTSQFIMAPDHPELLRVAATIDAVGAAFAWKNGLTWPQVKESLKAQDKICLHRGDVSKPGVAEYAGMYFLTGNNAKRFTVLDGNRVPLTAKDGYPYSGSYGNAIVDIWAMDHQSYGRRISCTITGIQHVRHGDAFGGGAAPAAPEEFGIVAGSADAALPTKAPAENDPTGGLL